MNLDEEKSLAARAITGDKAARNELFGLYHREVTKFVCAFCGTTEAQVAAQETFVRAWRGIKGLNGSFSI